MYAYSINHISHVSHQAKIRLRFKTHQNWKYSAWKTFKKCCFHPSLRPSLSGSQQNSDSGTKNCWMKNPTDVKKILWEISGVILLFVVYFNVCNPMYTVIIFLQTNRCILANQVGKSPPVGKDVCSISGPMEGDTKWHWHRRGTQKKGVSIWVTKVTSGKSLLKKKEQKKSLIKNFHQSEAPCVCSVTSTAPILFQNLGDFFIQLSCPSGLMKVGGLAPSWSGIVRKGDGIPRHEKHTLLGNQNHTPPRSLT